MDTHSLCLRNRPAGLIEFRKKRNLVVVDFAVDFLFFWGKGGGGRIGIVAVWLEDATCLRSIQRCSQLTGCLLSVPLLLFVSASLSVSAYLSVCLSLFFSV